VVAWELTPQTGAELLRSQGLVSSAASVNVHPLEGGVSSIVLLAEAEGSRFVLKQPLSRFRVAAEWRVDDRRAFVEHAFARSMAAHVPPGSLARVRTFLPEARVLVFEALPPTFATWKQSLLAGNVDPGLGARAGRLLASIHAAGEGEDLRGRFRHPDLFDEQRLDPYFRHAARARPDLAPALEALVHRFGEREDLVHGDFSPKNLLTDGDRLVLVDHEVATRGDAAFDVAFLVSHLVLKAVRRPRDASALREAADAFVEAYEQHAPADEDGPGRVAAYLGGLLLARVLGKSPVEYLDEAGQVKASALGERLLKDAAPKWRDAFDHLGSAE